MKFSTEVTNKITQWKEIMTAMPTDQFLDYARMFLGEISTPFNKQKLVTQISTFFCQSENKKNIISLLGKNDLKIISLVKLIPESTKETIINFFATESDSFSIRSHLQNLEERMILYTDKINSKKIYHLNPIIEDELGNKIGIGTLIEKSACENHLEVAPINLNPLFLGTFVSFALTHPDLCKSDGSIKKKALKDFALICGLSEDNSKEGSNFAQAVCLLISSFRNLLLFVDKDGLLIPDWNRLGSFSRMNEIQQYIYLCSGAFWKGHFRKSLILSAQLLFDTITAMENFSYSRKMVTRLSSIIFSLTQESERSASRFEMLMAKTNNEEMDFSIPAKVEQILDACIAFGVLNKVGETQDGEEILKANEIFFRGVSREPKEKKCVSVESGFSVTVMPGLSFSDLLPLTKFMDAKRLDVAASFEINKKSVLRSFDFGEDLNSITENLNSHCVYSIPQNLAISLEDWFSSYSSATMYHGFVLCLNESNAVLAEKNSVLSPHILKKLAPGVLLLDFTDEYEAAATIAQSGLSFIGKVKTCSKENDIPTLPNIKNNYFAFYDGDFSESNFVLDEAETEKIIQSMKEKLDEMEIPVEQKEGLLSRINRRIIVNENQLQPASVHFDKTEASAMDNSGKVYIIDKAMQDENLIEVVMDLKSLPQIGLPIDLDKKNGTATIRQRNGNEFTIPISAAVKIRKVPVEIQF